MRRLSPHLAPAGYSPTRYAPLSPASELDQGQCLTDIQAIQRLFANGENGGYWPADPAYLYEDSAGTIPASVNGVVGLWANNVPGKPSAIQATTANKPYLRRTPASQKYWLDPNIATGALTATFASSLGSSCTIATVGPDGVLIKENQTITTTYNIAPAWAYASDILIINRALTVAEKALVTRHFNRNKPAYGSLQNAIPQMRGKVANNEMLPDWATKTSLVEYWVNNGGYLTRFPFINTAKATNFSYSWYNCPGLTAFPLIDTSKGTNFSYSWYYCTSLTAFPLIDTSQGTDFSSSWYNCTSLTAFPAGFFDNWIGVPATNCFTEAWLACSALTETSVSNILVSIAASGQSAPATGTGITLNGAPTLATIQANSTIMTAVTTLKSRNWTPTYKGTAL